jgi:glycine cleavage system H protein
VAAIESSLRKGLVLAGKCVLVVVGLLAFIALCVIARPVLLLAMLLGVAAVVLSFVSPRFRGWLESQARHETHYKGMRLISDIALHSTHSWASILPRGVLVGADDVVQATLGPVQHVELPAVGERVKAGDPLFVLRRGERSIAVRSPISGTVLATNERLLERPGIVNDDPFRAGWAVRLRADELDQETARLHRGKEARGWFQREIDRLLATLHGGEQAAMSMADGGAVVTDLYRHIDDDAWQRVTQSFFQA